MAQSVLTNYDSFKFLFKYYKGDWDRAHILREAHWNWSRETCSFVRHAINWIINWRGMFKG